MNRNPFLPQEIDRYSIWEMLVDRDIKAFVQEDWSMVEDDFVEEGFMGIDAGGIENPDAWKLTFPDLDTYRSAWLQQAKAFKEAKWVGDPEEILHKITVLRDIEIRQDSALIHKKFFGSLQKANGDNVPANWQTLYRCRKINGNWKIVGFVGYMPHFNDNNNGFRGIKQLPAGASQHITAGPYSPVLQIEPGKLVVISGQAALDAEGNVKGNSIEEQAAFTLENCRKQLESAGCGLNDVFKVNVYIKDLEDWPLFNEIYKKYFGPPLPVRTTVQTGLLMNLLLEIEMWAVKS